MKTILYSILFLIVSSAFCEDDTIQKNCSSLLTSAFPQSCDENELSQSLEKFQNRFKTIESRIKNKEELTKTLDEIILQSPFASIVQCRDNLIKDKVIDFKVNFIDPSSENDEMSVEQEATSNVVTLNFSTKKSAQNILMVYLHELTHVCQVKKDNDLRNETTGVTIALKGLAVYEEGIMEYNRFDFLREIEAFQNQQKAYTYFTGISKRFCREESNLDSEDTTDLFESYVGIEKALDKGYFAQSIIYAYYFDLEDAEKKTQDQALFELDSSFHNYKDPDLQVNNGTFQLKSLNGKMRSEIEALNIKVIEP